MLKHRLTQLEKSADVLANAACPLCKDGFGPAFVLVRWHHEDDTHRDEPGENDIFNAEGNCRACGRNWGQVTLQLFEDLAPEGARP